MREILKVKTNNQEENNEQGRIRWLQRLGVHKELKRGFTSPRAGPQTATPPTEQTAIVATVTGRAAIVRLSVWDWLRCAAPPYNLNTHRALETFLTCFPMVIFFQNIQLDLGQRHLTCSVAGSCWDAAQYTLK